MTEHHNTYLAQSHPDLAAQVIDAHLVPTLRTGTHTKVWWRCPVNSAHTWKAEVVSRTRGRQSGCPFCSGRRPVPGVNDLATTHPDLAAQLLHPEQASVLKAGSNKRVAWRCAVHPEHVWSIPVRNRTTKDAGCPLCTGRSQRPHRRHPTLASIHHPVLAQAADPETTGQLTLGSGQKVEWVCTQCPTPHTYMMSVRKKIAGQRCPIATGRTIAPGINDLATTHPDLAAQLVDQSLAMTISHGSALCATWRCSTDPTHTWSAPVYSRVAGNGCPQCASALIGTSAKEQALLAVVRAADPRAQGRVIIAGYEVDICVGDLVVEFNGTYWHSEAAGRHRTYHNDRLNALRAHGYDLLTVWEDTWDDPAQRLIVVRTIAHRLHAVTRLPQMIAAAGLSIDPTALEHMQRTVGARTLIPVTVSGTQAAQFLRVNHIQGDVALSKAFALVDDAGTLYALLGLRSPSHAARTRRREGVWEIQRYATRCSVPGGFTRLLAHAEHVLHDEGIALTQWVSFSANELGRGSLYEASGFTVDRTIPPSYWYTGGPLRGKRAPKESFQKRRFHNDPNLMWDPAMTEHELALANSMTRVWDCGKTRWIKTVSS